MNWPVFTIGFILGALVTIAAVWLTIWLVGDLDKER
jgi:hypothetical protein